VKRNFYFLLVNGVYNNLPLFFIVQSSKGDLDVWFTFSGVVPKVRAGKHKHESEVNLILVEHVDLLFKLAYQHFCGHEASFKAFI
jgi:hypothetical protein